MKITDPFDAPTSRRLFERAMRVAGGGISRRGFLTRVAVVGSALSVAPVKFLTQPVSAAGVIRCSDCGPGSKCCGSYTAFCCEINDDSANACPEYTEIGGWWKCTNYTGHNLCDKEGFRYYIDCNRKPGKSCPGGCHCADNNCSQRKACCNVFKYGQCNVNMAVTEIACRVIKCDRPCAIWPNQCNCSPYMEDPNTCSHEAGCLGDEPALSPPAAGGRH